MVAAVAAVLSTLDGIFSLKNKEIALKAFLGGQRISALRPTGFAKLR